MADFKPDNATEALADAWASIDGKRDKFRAGKGATDIREEPGGYYSGYTADADSMIKRLRARGYDVRKMEDEHGSGAQGNLRETRQAKR